MGPHGHIHPRGNFWGKKPSGHPEMKLGLGSLPNCSFKRSADTPPRISWLFNQSLTSWSNLISVCLLISTSSLTEDLLSRANWRLLKTALHTILLDGFPIRTYPPPGRTAAITVQCPWAPSQKAVLKVTMVNGIKNYWEIQQNQWGFTPLSSSWLRSSTKVIKAILISNPGQKPNCNWYLFNRIELLSVRKVSLSKNKS